MGKIKKDQNLDVKPIKLNHGVSNKDYGGRAILDNIGDDISTMQRIFEIFNEELFEGQLDVPLIYIIPGLKIEYRVEMPEGWVKVKGDKEETDCIKVYISEEVYKKTLKEICITLVAIMIMQYDVEMFAAHKADNKKWIRLINNNNNYFGRRYREECRKRGLIVVEEDAEAAKKGKKPEVMAGEKFSEVYENYGIDRNFRMVHQYIPVIDNKEKASGQSMRLFICPGCGMKIRVTKSGDVDVRCYNGKCKGNKFEPKEGD